MKLKQAFKHLNSGQAIVLIALAAIGLFAMMGLAIDGGRLLLLRRDTQNAADAAAIAAGRALCTGNDPVAAGLAAADANGYNNDEVADTVIVEEPTTDDLPITLSDATCIDCYIKVTVNGEIPPTFIGLVYGGDLVASSSAVGICNPDANADSNQAPDIRAVWAKGNCSPHGVKITGSSITVEGGLHSNGSMTTNPSGSGGNTVSGATSVATLCGGCTTEEPVHSQDKIDWSPYPGDDGIGDGDGGSYLGDCTGACFISSVPPGTELIPTDGKPYVTTTKSNYPVSYTIDQFQSPGGTYYQQAHANSEYYEHTSCGTGFWSWAESNGYVSGTTLKDGLYYSTCDIDDIRDSLTGKVTIVTTGSMHIHGNGQQWEPYINDELLLFANENSGCGGKGAIKFSGSNNTWNGIVYAPNGEINISGSTNDSQAGCLIGLSVHVQGARNTIKCDPAISTTDPEPLMWLGE